MGHIQAINKSVTLLKQFGGLSTCAHHHVHAYKTMGNQCLDASHFVGKQSRIVMAAHKPQHRVAATLQRDVEMWHKLSRAGAELYYLIGEQIRLYRRYAIALYALHRVKASKQVHQALTCAVPVIAYVHPGYHYLCTTGSGHLARLSGYTAASAATSGKRNGAVAAVIVTTVLHLQKVAGAVATLARRHKLADPGQRGHHHFALTRRQTTHHVFGHFAFLLASKHHIHPSYLGHLLALELGVTSGHHHQRIGITLYQFPYLLSALGIGKRSHATSVHHTHVGHLATARRQHSALLQLSPYRGRFSKVKFAPQSRELHSICLLLFHLAVLILKFTIRSLFVSDLSLTTSLIAFRLQNYFILLIAARLISAFLTSPIITAS